MYNILEHYFINIGSNITQIILSPLDLTNLT
jgi:hypothetical protein